MSIDHGKVLAVVEEMTAPLVSYKFTPSQQAHITSWANKLRAIAQPAEAVNPDLCTACKTWPVDDDSCPNCGREKPFTPAEAVDGAPIPDGYRVTEFIPGRWCWDLQDELGGWSGDGSYYGHYAAAAIGAWRDYADTLERAAMDEASAHDAAQGAVAWRRDAEDLLLRLRTMQPPNVVLQQVTMLGQARDILMAALASTHPQAAPAQGGGMVLVGYVYNNRCVATDESRKEGCLQGEFAQSLPNGTQLFAVAPAEAVEGERRFLQAMEDANAREIGETDAAQGAVATVCLVGERYAHGHMVSVELQLAGEDAPAPKIGDRYYTHPQAALAAALKGATP